MPASNADFLIQNDGTMSKDRIRIMPSKWETCVECERSIYYIRVGDKCVFHSLPVSVEDIFRAESANVTSGANGTKNRRAAN